MSDYDRGRCDCGLPEREAENRRRWDSDMPNGGIYAVNLRPWPPFPVWHSANCAALGDYPLSPLSMLPTCDKCNSRDIRAEFHEARWHYRPHHHDYWRVDLYSWSCLLTSIYRPVEHIDRECNVCHFRWLERTAGA